MKKYVVKKVGVLNAEPYAIVSDSIISNTINKYVREGYRFEDLTAFDGDFYIVFSIEDVVDEE